MRRLVCALLALTLAAPGLTGCTSRHGGPRIVVTTNILGDVVDALVGDQVAVLTLMPPGADPHSFEISAAQAADLERADLLVSNGLGLEEGLTRHVENAAVQGVPLLEAGDAVSVIRYSDDGASGPDPHWWTDPTQMASVIDALVAAIEASVQGVDSGALRRSAEAYRAALRALDTDAQARFGTLGAERRVLVTNHHVLGYLARRYDFRIVGAVIPGGSTLAAPSASDLDELATAIRTAGVPAIFAESSQPDRLIKVLAQETGVQVRVVTLFSESLTQPGDGAGSYLELMRANTDLITAALS